MTPADVHYGRVPDIVATRSQTLDAAFPPTQARFKDRPPASKLLPQAVWSDPPVQTPAHPEEPPEQR